MRTMVAIAILLMVVMLAGLVLYIIGRRSLAGLIGWLEGRRRARLEAALGRWLGNSSANPPPEIAAMWRYPDRAIFASLCLDRVRQAEPAARARLVGWLEAEGFVERWLRDLSSRSHWKRARAAELLGRVQVERSVEPLVAALDDPVFDVRMRAAKALGALGGKRARGALVAALADETRWSVIRIADLLSDMGPDIVTELMDGFPQMSRSSRLATLDLVSHLGDDKVSPFLMECLDDLDRDVRARAAAALGRIRDLRAIPALRTALQDNEWPVRAMSAKSLGRLGDQDAIPALCASLRDEEWWVRANAGEALHTLGIAGINALVNMLDDQDQFAREQALAALEGSGFLNDCLAGMEAAAEAGADTKIATRLIESLVTRHSRSKVAAVRERLTDPAARRALDRAIARWETPREASL